VRPLCNLKHQDTQFPWIPEKPSDLVTGQSDAANERDDSARVNIEKVPTITLPLPRDDEVVFLIKDITVQEARSDLVDEI
jgi:hypothetical protein